MKVLRQSSIESKTISTSPSFKALSNPTVHSYHQYQTLLRYVTSFMADLRLNVVELKQIVYKLIGVEINTRSYECGASSIHCQQCEIQFMMNNCRKARQDIFRITSLLRGYTYALHTGSQQLLNTETARYQHEQIYYKNNEQVLEYSNLTDRLQNYYDRALQTKQIKDIGFLTFRQNLNGEKHHEKYAFDSMIEQENLQQSHNSLKEQSMKRMQINKNNTEQRTVQLQQQTNSQQNNKSIQQQFKKVLELINLVRKEVNQCQQKQTSIKTKIQTARIKYPIYNTPTLTNDSPRNNYQLEEA